VGVGRDVHRPGTGGYARRRPAHPALTDWAPDVAASSRLLRTSLAARRRSRAADAVKAR
jgi:hypothetical protein